MEHTYWRKQSADKALYDDLLWSRPENKAHAGKLLIVGGNGQGFTRPAQAYGQAEQAGAGSVRVFMPDSLQKTIGRAFPAGEFGPSTPSGSFASASLGEILPLSSWADGVLIAGDLGRNSETAIMLEKFIEHYQGQITVTCDAVDYLIATPYPVLQRPDTLLVLSFAQLQKLGTAIKYSNAFSFNMDLLRLIDSLHELTKRYKFAVITKHHENLIIAYEGQVITMKLAKELPVWRLNVATFASVWWLQNPTKSEAAFSTAIFDFLTN
jgi:hypothetical protein